MKKWIWVLIGVIVVVVVAINFIFFYSPNNHWNSKNNTQLVGGCAGVQEIYQEECCENWANENNVMPLECLGGWRFNYEKNQCEFRCGHSANAFCGVSKDECASNSDCVINGYFCQNKNNVTEVPSEIWKDCYNFTKYNARCDCAAKQCVWLVPF